MIDLLLLILLLTGGSWLIGWWAFLLVPAAWGAWRRWQRPAWLAALAAALAWGIWLSVAGPLPTMLKLVDRLGALFSAPGPVVVVLPMVYAALLAWAAARLMQGLLKSRPD